MLMQEPNVEVFFPPGPPPGEMILIALTIVAALIGAIYILGPIARAFARRIEGKGVDPAVQEELRALRESASEMDGLRDRLMELEERIDFAERLLAKSPQAERLPAPHGER
jgi:Tfp pilus assembly protein PilO